MRRIGAPAAVTVSKGRPVAFAWRGQRYRAHLRFAVLWALIRSRAWARRETPSASKQAIRPGP